MVMLRVAVADESDTTWKVPAASDRPAPNPPTPVAVVRCVPVNVTGTELPREPLAGLMPVRVGAVTVNVPVLATPAVVSVTVLAVAAAVPVMVKVAVTRPELTQVTLLAVTPVPDTDTVGTGVCAKLLPFRLTVNAVPCRPEFGLIDVSDGESTVNVPVLVPPAVVSVRVLALAVAPEVMTRLAVTWLESTHVTLFALTPVPETPTVGVGV